MQIIPICTDGVVKEEYGFTEAGIIRPAVDVASSACRNAPKHVTLYRERAGVVVKVK